MRRRPDRTAPPAAHSGAGNTSASRSLRALCAENSRLKAQIAALEGDNRQLRAALRMFSEAARNSPPVLPIEEMK